MVAQPVHGIDIAVAHHLDQLAVAEIIAAVIGLDHVQFGGVEQILVTRGQVFGILLFHLGLPGSHALVLRLKGDVTLDLLFLAVSQRRILEIIRVSRLIVAAREDGVAAVGRALFQNDDGSAFLSSRQRRGKARAAAADNHNVGGEFDFFARNLFNRDGLERVHVAAGLLHSVGHGFKDAVGGEGRRSRDVNAQGLILHDFRGDLFDSRVADAGCVVAGNHFDAGDRVRIKCDGYLDLVEHAGAGSRVCACRVGQRRNGGDQHHQTEQPSQQFLHVVFLRKQDCEGYNLLCLFCTPSTGLNVKQKTKKRKKIRFFVK